MKYIDRGYQHYHSIIDTILQPHVDHYTNYSTQQLSNIHVGGIVDMFVNVSTQESLVHAINTCIENRVPYKVIGGGNNVYFTERVQGMIIQNTWSQMVIEDGSFVISSGALLFEFVLFAFDNGYDIFQLAGIPGTVGGAIYGNSGAYGLEIKDILHSCTILNRTEIETVPAADMKLSYRSSCLKDGSCSGILLTATFSGLPKISSSEHSMSKIIEVLQIRNAKIPSENTLGSVFRNKLTASGKVYAWQILDAMGLRGQSRNGITFHPTHPNIWVNTGSATPSDLTRLIEEIVQQSPLDLEIERIGEHALVA